MLGDGNVRLPHPSNIGWLTHGGVASGAIKVRIHKVVSHRVTKVALQAPSLESSWVLGRGGLTNSILTRRTKQLSAVLFSQSKPKNSYSNKLLRILIVVC